MRLIFHLCFGFFSLYSFGHYLDSGATYSPENSEVTDDLLCSHCTTRGRPSRNAEPVAALSFSILSPQT